MNNYRTISKPIGHRITELLQSLQVLRDCVQGARLGKRYQLIPLFGQLRALVAEARRTNPPLLLDLAELLNIDLRVYAMPGVDENPLPPSLSDGLMLHVSGLPVSRHRILPRQIEMSLERFLNQKMLVFKGRYFSRRELVKLLAEKAGGAHFPRQVPEHYAELVSVAINGEPVLYNALLQIGETILDLGAWLVAQLCNFHMHFLLAVPPQSLEKPAVLFDAAYPNSRMRFLFGFERGLKPRFSVSGIDGAIGHLVVERVLDWTSVRHVAALLEIRPDLNTTMSLQVDGETYANVQLPYPIFTTGEHVEYRRFQNRSVEDASAGMAVGLAELIAFRGAIRIKEHGALYEYLATRQSDSNLKCVMFTPGSYGEAAPGSGTFGMTGVVRQLSCAEVLESRYPDNSEKASKNDVPSA